jgi:hypothetical protein
MVSHDTLHSAIKCCSRWVREEAEKVTPEERNEGWERIYTYRKWLLEKVFLEGTLVVLPVDEGKPNYRDATPRKLNPIQ